MLNRAVALLFIVVTLLLTSVSAQDFDELPATDNASTEIVEFLTAQERQWIIDNPGIRVSSELDWPPFNFYQDDRAQGFSVEYFDLLAHKLQLDYQYVEPATWDQLINQLQQRQLEVMLNIVQTPEREGYIRFTEPYYTNQNVIVSRADLPFKSMDALRGMRISVPAGGFYHELYKGADSEVQLELVDDAAASLVAVLEGRAQAALGQDAVMRYLINKLDYQQLAVTGVVLVANPDGPNMRVGVRSDWPMLQQLLNKAQQQITPGELTNLHQRWLSHAQVTATDSVVENSVNGRGVSWELLVGLALLLVTLPIWIAIAVARGRRTVIRKLLVERGVVRWLAILLVLLYLGVISLFTMLSLEQIEADIRAEVATNLVTINNATENAIRLWGTSVLREVHHWGSELQMVQLARQALQASGDADVDLSEALNAAYQHDLMQIGAANMVLVARDGRLLASADPQQTEGWQKPWQLDVLRQSVGHRAVYVPPFIGELGDSNNQLFHFITVLEDVVDEQVHLVLSFHSQTTFKPFIELAQNNNSGETYLIDVRGQMVSGSRFTEQLQQLSAQIPEFERDTGWLVRDPGVDLSRAEGLGIDLAARPLTVMASRASAGKNGVNIAGYRDYRGVTVFGAWRWSDDLQLAIATEIDKAEALAPFYQIRQVIIGTLMSIAVVTFLLMAVILWLGERVSKRLRELVQQSNEDLSAALSRLEAAELTRTMALDAANIGIWNVDVSSRKWWWDERSAALLGVPSKHASLAALSRLLEPQDQPLAWQHFQQTLASDEAYDAEFKLHPDSDTVRYVRARARASRGANDGWRIDGILIDVTDVRLAEEAAQRARERNELILNYAGEGIIGLDVHGQISFCNAAAASMLGYDKAELVGQSMHPLVHYAHADGSAYPPHDCPMRLATAEGISRRVDDEVLWRKDGQSFSVEYTAVPFLQDDKVVGSVVVFRDITERKRQEQRILAREQQVKTILEASPDPLVIVDRNALIIAVNKRTEQVFEYDREALLGQPIEMLLPERFRKHHVALRDSFMRNPEARLFTTTASGQSFIAVTRGGREFPIELSLNPIETDDGMLVVSAVHDISERKRAEQALRDSEQRLALTTAGSGDGLWDFELDRHVYWYSDRFRSLLGYSDEGDFPNNLESWFSRIHPDQAAAVKEAFNQHINVDSAFKILHRLRHKDGSWRWFQARAQALRTGDGRAYRIAGSITDVDDMQEMQQLLTSEREQLQNILDLSPIGVGFTSDGILHFANPQFLAMTSAQLGSPIEALYVDASDRTRIIERLEREGQALNIETQMYGSDGVIRDILVSYLPVQFQGQSGILGWLLDITERKTIEAQIADSESRLQAAAVAANLGLWEYAPLSRELLTNRIWVTMFGYAAEQWLEPLADFESKWLRLKGGMESWASLIHPDDLETTMQLFYQQLAGESDAFRGEYRIRCADQSWRWVLVAGQVIERDEQGQALRMVGILSDINDEKGLQHELMAARDVAQEATRTKSNFLANMSHEIRTPMNAIIGMSHLALQTELNRKQRNYIEKVRQSAESLLGIINDILDFSKIEAGRLSLETIEFRLEDVLDNLALLISHKAEQKGLELLFDIPSDVPVALLGDPLRLGQILINLGNNAVKFTEQGEVVVAVRVVEQEGSRCRLEFTVRDTGIGLTAEQQKLLFRSFSQADSSTTRKFGGTGLGLAISKNLVGLMGGEIWVESEQGVGSTFGFRVDLTVQDLPMPVQRCNAAELANTRLLIVDDNATAGEILRVMLESMQFRVDYVSSGEAALQRLQQASDDPYQLVLMDWKMPGMDGIELAQRIEADTQLVVIPRIVMVTAYSRDDAIAAAQNLSIQSFLNKPVTPSSLLDAVMVAIGRDQLLDSRKYTKNSDAQEALAKLRGALILLVEDNEVNQELALELLQQNGMRVMLAEHGQQALELLDQHEFDGVLMDCQMPIMDGYTATRMIRQQSRWAQLPIIAMTANAMAGDREKVLDAGMNDHIPKPVNVVEMFATMARWITPKQLLAAAADDTVDDLGENFGQASGQHSNQHSGENSAEVLIPALDGIDTQAGLQRTERRPALYLRLLVKTYRNFSDFEQRYQQLKHSEQADVLQRLVHSLKGVAGNIGALQVAECAQQLEQQLAQPPVREATEQALLAAVAQMLSSLSGLQQPEQTSPAASVDEVNWQQLREDAEHLSELISNYDTDVIELWEQHEVQFSAIAAPMVMQKMQHALAHYDFEAALVIIQSLQAQIAENCA